MPRGDDQEPEHFPVISVVAQTDLNTTFQGKNDVESAPDVSEFKIIRSPIEKTNSFISMPSFAKTKLSC